jgi:hypothetical protein
MPVLRWLARCLVVLSIVTTAAAAEIAERPFLTLMTNRLDRLLDSVDVLLDVADRPELSDVLAERYRAARDFAGIDRTRPLGLMRTWRLDDPATPETEQPADVLFVPVSDRAAFLKTITFDAVSFRSLTPDLVAIDRPGEPYHVLFKDNVAWMGDEVAQLAAFASRRERLLGRVPATAHLALLMDFEQISLPGRDAALRTWTQAWEPLFQRRDGESTAAYEWRTQNTAWLLRDLPELARAAQQLLITETLHAEDRRSEWTFDLRLSNRTAAARQLLSWKPQPSPWSRLDDPQAVSFGAFRGLRLDATEQTWDFAWQLFGHPFEQRTAIVVLSGPGAVETAQQARPSGPAEILLGDGVLKRVTLPGVPVWMRRFVGWDPEIWLGAATGRVWLGFGPIDAARKRLEHAHAVLTGEAETPDRPVAVRLRISARDLVPFVPGFDPGWADQQLVRGGDQIRGSAEATATGLVVRVEFEIGVLRVLGAAIAHDLALDLDQALSLPIIPDR